MQIKTIVTNLFLGLLMLFPMTSLAQLTNSESPYSLGGIGQLRYQGFISQEGMGGIGRAIREESSFSFTNPASYSALEYTDFEFGARYQSADQSTTSISRSYTTGSFQYIALGLPILNNKGGLALGLIPLANTGYLLSEDAVEDGNDIKYFYQGEGAINRIYIGAAYEVARGLSVGINGEYDFGNISRSVDKQYVENTNVLSLQDVNDTRYRGFGGTLGVQYSVQNAEDLQFVFGGTYTLNRNYAADNDRLFRRYNSLGRFIVDTLLQESEPTQDLAMPVGFGAGIQVGKTSKWGIGAEYEAQVWSDFTDILGEDRFNDFVRYSFGAFYQPLDPQESSNKTTYSKIGSFIRATKYFGGVRYEQGYVSFENQAINELGISFGIGLPIKTRKILATGSVTIVSRLNITAEYIQRGTTNNNLIQEDIWRISVGLNFSDKWFIKRKFQ